jgi:hypothetical protein
MKAIKPVNGNGPKRDWGDWRRRRDKAIMKPPKSRVGERLAAVNKRESSEKTKGDET